ncbi:hypothetical protein [Alkalihalobacillus sp. R86527]|uniref:hypothetical protein n=1 Tax=Alkalihalobacillus sp. R86527 TaxID=3093863 RepID=UPI00366E667C
MKDRGGSLIKVLRIVLSAVTVGLSVFVLVTDRFELMPYLMFGLGTVMFVTGIAEWKGNRKENAAMLMVTSAFVYTVILF